MKDSCYFCDPVKDMSATIPTCSLFRELGICPCSDPSFDCPFYIHQSSVRSIVVKFVLSRQYPNLKL